MLINSNIDNAALRSLEYLADNMRGRNFALAMRDEEGYLTVYPREHQPCQGGEMRKYKFKGAYDAGYKEGALLHGDDCTRPDDPRPGDLCHPFPDGTPEAIAVCLYTSQNADLMEFFLSDDSPYRKGIGGRKNVDIRKSGGRVSGLIFKNTSVDPTVLVNFLQFLQYDYSTVWPKLISAGMTPSEAAVSLILMGANDGTSIIPETYTYYFPLRASIRRIVEGDPHDLTGGTFRDRYDYNRPKIQDLFKAGKGEKVTIWAEELRKRSDVTGMYDTKAFSSVEKYVEAAKEVIREAMTPETKTEVSIGLPEALPIIEHPEPKKAKKTATKKAA